MNHADKRHVAHVDESTQDRVDQSDLIVSIVSTITRACARLPDQVEVTYDKNKHRVSLSVASKDRGVLIGREGRNLRALEDALALALTYSSDQRGSVVRDLPLIEFSGGDSKGRRSRDQRPNKRSDKSSERRDNTRGHQSRPQHTPTHTVG